MDKLKLHYFRPAEKTGLEVVVVMEDGTTFTRPITRMQMLSYMHDMIGALRQEIIAIELIERSSSHDA